MKNHAVNKFALFRLDRPHAPFESLVNWLMWGAFSALIHREADRLRHMTT